MPEGRVPVTSEYFALAASLRALVAPRLVPRDGRGIVIGIGGESGSGKSVTATCLARELEGAGFSPTVLHQDDYFHLPPRTNHEHRSANLAHVGPYEVNLALMASHIVDFRARRDHVTGPLVDYPSNRFVTQRHDFAGRDALIVEGTYVLQLADMDIRIFLDATHEATRERRRVRNRDIDAPFVDRVLEIEHRIIAPQSAVADIVIADDFTVRERR